MIVFQKKLTLTIQFSRGYVLPHLITFLLSAWFIGINGLSAVAPMFFLWLVVSFSLIAYSLQFRAGQFYYFYNRGIGKRELWVLAMIGFGLGFIAFIWMGYLIHNWL